MLDRRMRALRQFGVLVLLLASCLTPAMACVVPGATLTTEGRACCRMMQNQCEQMKMPASHGCCQKAPANVYADALDANVVALHPVAITVVWLTSPELLNPTSSVTAWVEHHDYSPPKSPPSTISILRI
jgi:hypothetical protein